MPLYEYRCESCHKVTERIQKFSDPLMEICPACGGTVKKLLSSPAFQFKGTGWYITDYARKSSNGSDKSSTSDSSEKSQASEKSEKSDKSDKSDKPDKPERSETKSESSAAPSTKSNS